MYICKLKCEEGRVLGRTFLPGGKKLEDRSGCCSFTCTDLPFRPVAQLPSDLSLLFLHVFDIAHLSKITLVSLKVKQQGDRQSVCSTCTNVFIILLLYMDLQLTLVKCLLFHQAFSFVLVIEQWNGRSDSCSHITCIQWGKSDHTKINDKVVSESGKCLKQNKTIMDHNNGLPGGWSW